MTAKMSFAHFLLLLISLQQVQATENGTCLYKWIRQAGVPSKNAKKYEKLLQAGQASEATLRSDTLSPSLLSVVLQGDFNSATAIKNCIAQHSENCHDYNPCKRGGECVFNSTQRINTCRCRKGLHGDLCEKDCDECSDEAVTQGTHCTSLRHNCHSNATCTNTHGSFHCSCKPGFIGNGMSCLDAIDCKRKPCSRNAGCKDTFGSYTCSCFPGYQGNGKVCQDVMECHSNPCQNGGQCHDLINGYTCLCPIGYEGTHCKKQWLQRELHKPLPGDLRKLTQSMMKLAAEVKKMAKTVATLKEKVAKNYCQPNPCQNGGRCIDQDDSYMCLCKFGYIGKNCSIGKSCQSIYSAGVRKSGTYWIKPKGKAPMMVFCEMVDGGGWMRVVDIDPRNTGCPAAFRLLTIPQSICALRSGGCTSAFFGTFGMAYSEVRGYAYGHQYASMDAFSRAGILRSNSINGAYVDGISITHASPRKHIWTFAIGASQDARLDFSTCPCAQYPGHGPPSFVGNDYYCDSGNKGAWEHTWYNERLWDGQCYSKSKCCNRSGMPFFVKQLGSTVKDRLEVRLCTNQNTGDENLGVERMVLYVR